LEEYNHYEIAMTQRKEVKGVVFFRLAAIKKMHFQK
jgi:hypothetical protein